MSYIEESMLDVILLVGKGSDVELMKDIFEIAKTIVEKSYGIKINGFVEKTNVNETYIEVDGNRYPLKHSVPSIKDLVDLLVMVAVPYTKPYTIGLRDSIVTT
ncbi:hypothetical protein J4526_00330 [Desulfurococcaceae archaeon MEX13E-LK6-19]|nr:hypothetical protein J4526_00330 [Desulfurococcaceae archaeon MEX13E-LK6-19]